MIDTKNHISATDAALTLIHEGRLSEARELLSSKLHNEEAEALDSKIDVLLKLVTVEWMSGDIETAFEFATEAKRLAADISDFDLLGRVHSNHALILRKLSESKNESELLDRAIMEYTAASFYYEQAGNAAYQARIENNLAILQKQLERFDDALIHANKAQQIAKLSGDISQLAYILDTTAQIYLEMKEVKTAYRIIVVENR